MLKPYKKNTISIDSVNFLSKEYQCMSLVSTQIEFYMFYITQLRKKKFGDSNSERNITSLDFIFKKSANHLYYSGM